MNAKPSQGLPSRSTHSRDIFETLAHTQRDKGGFLISRAFPRLWPGRPEISFCHTIDLFARTTLEAVAT